MSMIFSQAVNAIKSNNNPASSSLHESALSGDRSGNNANSIRNRIKKPQKAEKKVISINRPGDVMQVSRKIIKKPNVNKDLRLKLKRSASPDSPVWRHDRYTEGPPMSSVTVFLRNIPESISAAGLKNLLNQKEADYVVGLKLERDTAEINFSRQDAAERAIGKE